jgi:hypothetical protein
MHSTSLKTSPGAQNMKTGPDALGIAENESGRAKHENRTRRPRYRLCDPFSRLPHLGRELKVRIAEEGHRDPSNCAFEYLYGYEMHI